MGNRGPKSVFSTVKGQRVNGSYWGSSSIKMYSNRFWKKPLNLFNSFGRRLYSTFNKVPIHPWFWSGLSDGEATFNVIIDEVKSRKLGYRVQAKFQIGLHIKDIYILNLLKSYLGGIGSIHIYPKSDRVIYSIDSIDHLLILISFFDKYPLLTQKFADYTLFKEVVNLINTKAHLTLDGLNKIINIKASINKGLSDKLKSQFPNYVPVPRPVVSTTSIPHPAWIAGFASGEGNFDVRTPKATNKTGVRVQLRFRISQHIRDINLLNLMVKYLGGVGLISTTDSAVYFTVVNFSDISNVIIPLFNKYPILGIKSNDFNDWCKIHSLMSKGLHLTPEGIEAIKTIKSGMNTQRDWKGSISSDYKD